MSHNETIVTQFFIIYNTCMFKFLKSWLPVILWAGMIFYLSGVPNLNSGLAAFWDVFLRKLAHAAEFGILNFLIFRALSGYGAGFKKALLLALLLTIVYAFFDETHQYFVAERQARIKDVAMDGLGAGLISLTLVFLKNLQII